MTAERASTPAAANELPGRYEHPEPAGRTRSPDASAGALDAVKRLVSGGHKLHIVPQNLYEFWVVCTRPIAVNGLEKTTAEAATELASLKALFLLLDETPAIYGVWERLVVSTPVVGKNGHDARLVAAMTIHGLTHLLTFNTQDFRQYPGITVVTPADVLTP